MVSFEENINSYLVKREPDSRYASFDYCFNYFQSFRQKGNTKGLAERDQLQLSCMHLGFYLASWGMLRGSTKLLKMSARCLVPIIETIASFKTAVWAIDAHCYTEENIQQLLVVSRAIRQSYPGMSDTLVTKIMLGVFGNVPAFDDNFKKGFQVSTFGSKALRKIGDFYKNHSDVIDKYTVPTLDFVSGEPTQQSYTLAKVIDMAFFIEGDTINQKLRNKQSQRTSAAVTSNRRSRSSSDASPVYKLILQKTYYEKGFFNLGVEVERYVRKSSGPATLLLGKSRTPLSVHVNRNANQNGTPRIMGSAELRNWLQSNFQLGENVEIQILGPEEYWMRRSEFRPAEGI